MDLESLVGKKIIKVIPPAPETDWYRHCVIFEDGQCLFLEDGELVGPDQVTEEIAHVMSKIQSAAALYKKLFHARNKIVNIALEEKQKVQSQQAIVEAGPQGDSNVEQPGSSDGPAGGQTGA